MFVSPTPSKRQLPSKQPTSPPYTPQVEEDFEEAYQNSRTSAFDIPEPQPEPPQRGHRSRRSTSLPYNLVQQHIQRLHQLHQLHRTREQQISSSNLASRRGLNSSHHLSLNHRAQQVQAVQARRQDRNPVVSENIFEHARNIREERLDDSQDEIIDFSSLDDFVSSLDNNNNNTNISSSSSNNSRSIGLVDGVVQRNNNINNDIDSSNRSHHHHHHSSSAALDNVIRRVNLLRQISQQQESRMMRSSRHHRSSTGHSSSGRSSRTTSSQNVNVDRRRDDLIHRGIDVHPSSTIRHSGLPEPTLLYPNEHNVPSLPPVQRLSAWHTRRGVNWSTDPQSQQRSERRSSFVDDFYSTSDIPHSYDDDHHMSRILSPIPRRYDARFAASLTSLPIGNENELLGNNNNIDNRSNVDRISSSNEPVRTEQRGSASGEVC